MSLVSAPFYKHLAPTGAKSRAEAVGFDFCSKASGDDTQARIGIAGGAFAVIFYLVLGVTFVLPTALAAWKAFKRRPGTRMWGTIAVILIIGVAPLGTALGLYALWFFFSAQGKEFYSAV